MKKILLMLLFSAFLFSALASAPYTEFKVGYMNPNAAKAGYLFGMNLGRMIDESLSWSFEANYFQKGYKKVTTIYEYSTASGTHPDIKQLELEFTTRMIPVFAKLNYEHPLGINSPLYLRASAGLGWEMVWNNEKNYVDGVKKTRFYHGFGWQVSGGVSLAISSSANFFADIFYNNSTVKRNRTISADGLPTWEELDISGMGLKFGVSIVGFGW